MIEVYVAQRGEKSRLFVTGHASEGPLRDVVCAAVSALGCALVFYADRDKDCRRLRYHMASGELFLSCHGLGKGFEVIKEGLTALALRYPDYIRLCS